MEQSVYVIIVQPERGDYHQTYTWESIPLSPDASAVHIHKCTSEELMHDAVTQRGITGPRVKVNQIQALSADWPDPNAAKLRRAPAKSV